jgi:hypothetical protein
MSLLHPKQHGRHGGEHVPHHDVPEPDAAHDQPPVVPPVPTHHTAICDRCGNPSDNGETLCTACLNWLAEHPTLRND